MTASQGTLLSFFQRQNALLNRLHLTDLAEQLASLQTRLLDETFRVLLVGEHSRGKTTFLNALLGRDVLAASVLPVSTVNVIRYGDSPAVRAGLSGALQTIPLDALTDDTSFSRVELTWRLALCQNDVEFIEYPSMSEAPTANGFMEAITDADLVLIMVTCDALYSKSESQWVDRIKAAGHSELFFICNGLDRIQIAEREAITRAAYARLPVNPDRIFLFSALQAVEGDLAARHAVQSLQDKLIAFIRQHRQQVKYRRAARLLQQNLAVAYEHLTHLLSEVTTRRDATHTTIRHLREAYDQLQAEQRRVSKDLEAFRQGTREVVETMTSNFIRGVAHQVEDWVLVYEGADLHQHITTRLAQTCDQWLRQEMEPYLQRRLENQRQALHLSIQSFIGQLHVIYTALPDTPPSASLEINLAAFAIASPTVMLSRCVQSGQRSAVTLLSMPEVLVTLIGTVIATILPLPRFLPVLGSALTGYLAYQRWQGFGVEERETAGRAYAQEVQAQSDSIVLTMARAVDGRISVMQAQVDRSLSAIMQDTEKRVRMQVDKLREGVATSTASELQNVLQEMRALAEAVETWFKANKDTSGVLSGMF